MAALPKVKSGAKLYVIDRRQIGGKPGVMSLPSAAVQLVYCSVDMCLGLNR